VQFYMHPFSVPGLERSSEAQAYIDEYYQTFEEIKAEGLDALIITGANVANPSLDQEPFWEPLVEVIGWAQEYVTSVLCSCLSTHALVKHLYGIERHNQPSKTWGVFTHRVTQTAHPLLRDINTRFDVPHSRWNEVTRAEMEAAGLTVLIDGERGVHTAVSPDLFRIVYFQGHPEYNINSLLKEYKRDLLLHLNGQIELPPFPENYFSAEAEAVAYRYLGRALYAREHNLPLPEFPENEFLPHLDNTWGDTGKAIVNNWLGLIYKLTHRDRKRVFVNGIDPDDPLGLLKTS